MKIQWLRVFVGLVAFVTADSFGDFNVVGELSKQTEDPRYTGKEFSIEFIDHGSIDEQKIPDGATVSVEYTGKLRGGIKVFDKSDKPFLVTLGKGQVIKGWEVAIPYLKRGQKAIVTVPADLAYGDSGFQNKIAPGETIYFDLKVIDWWVGAKPQPKAQFSGDVPNFDQFDPNFSKNWNDRVIKEKQAEAKKNGIEYTPEKTADGKEKTYEFNYG